MDQGGRGGTHSLSVGRCKGKEQVQRSPGDSVLSLQPTLSKLICREQGEVVMRSVKKF